ncbi:AAA family ATPase [Alkalibacillus sp. S2W]|uniref:AAA family ATPase n=1 Tax=Alkalibacillus sp. S2W TaxID=3386553 RepID=UPI00398D6580
MIKNISMKNVASYDDTGVKIEDLNKVNFFYGNNGSGKTSISEFLRNSHNFQDCSIEWSENEYSMQVYNKHFVEEYFGINDSLKGIYTFGKEQNELFDRRDELIQDIDKYEDKLGKLETQIQGRNQELSSHWNTFRENIWNKKNKYEPLFQSVFEGFRSSKDKFAQMCIDEVDLESELLDYDKIQEQEELLFNIKDQSPKNYIPTIEYNSDYEKKEIFEEPIIGKQDVNISKLIQKLNNSDWVKQGMNYIVDAEGTCPFCQQELYSDFEEQLLEYFNEEYTEKINILNEAVEKYNDEINSVIQSIQKLVDESSKSIGFKIDSTLVNNKLEIINSILNENNQLMNTKKSEPSRKIKPQSIKNVINDINEEITRVNQEIKEFNEKMANLEEEQGILKKRMWRYFCEELKLHLTTYKESIEPVENALDGLRGSFEQTRGYIEEFRTELSDLESRITSVHNTVTEINSTLKSFGFTNFELTTSDTETGTYKIIREDGSEAKDTLSEGEKTFITFLYFYNLIKGSHNEDDLNTKKIIVIDDPISSLDSNVLFVVSSLIRNLINDINDQHSRVAQLIVLTHNVYFHKEITFNRNGENSHNKKYWIIRKDDNNNSSITHYDKNPIKSSYELLWNELSLLNDQNLITMQNVMRRILENYFKYFGSISYDHILDKFEDEEKIICQSLISWINDGSHSINEDLFIELPDNLTDKYKKVFKSIFEYMGQAQHYKMMMGEDEYQITR